MPHHPSRTQQTSFHRSTNKAKHCDVLTGSEIIGLILLSLELTLQFGKKTSLFSIWHSSDLFVEDLLFIINFRQIILELRFANLNSLIRHQVQSKSLLTWPSWGIRTADSIAPKCMHLTFHFSRYQVCDFGVSLAGYVYVERENRNVHERLRGVKNIRLRLYFIYHNICWTLRIPFSALFNREYEE